MFLHRSRTNRRGFTLTEMAIVLGIMGTIIGAIWVAAAKVNSNKKAKQVAEQVVQIIASYKPFFKNGPSGVPQWTDITALGVANGAFPQDMIIGAGVQHPWGGPVNVYDSSLLPWSGILIRYSGLSQRACNLVANAIVDPTTQQFLQIGLATGPVAIQSPSLPNPIGRGLLPSVAAWAQANCANAANNLVDIMVPIL